MSNDSEKGNRTGKQVIAWFLPLFMLLMSVLILILIIEAWYPELLDPLWQFIEDKQIFMIITLLVCVSLLSFLIQVYMYATPRKTEKTGKHVVACFLLPLALPVFVLILILIIEAWYPELLNPLWQFIKDKQIFMIITLLVSVSLLSFLIQIYMNQDRKKNDKTWKNVARFVLLPVLLLSVLISVLILINEAWYPVLSFLPGFIKEKQIFTIIILLACVSLLSFLLQRYMNKEPEKVNEIWKIVAYPVHWAIRLIARAVLLLAILLTIIITPTFYPVYFVYRLNLLRLSAWFMLVLTILATVLISSSLIFLLLILISFFVWPLETLLTLIFFFAESPDLLESLRTFISNEWNNLNENLDIIMIIALLTSIGLFSLVLSKSIEDIRESLSCIKEKIVEVLRDKWWRKIDIDIKKSLEVTWYCYCARVWSFIKETFTQSQKLFLALLLLCFILVCGYISVKILNEWQQDVEDSLVDIRTDTANLILLRSSGLSPAYLSGKGDTISLVYPPEGNLISKKGICPEGDNLIWLKLFKQAILKCSEDNLMKLKVQGFASAAPVRVDGDTTKANSLNREIANQRAEALIYFLTLANSKIYNQDSCKVALNDSLISKQVKSDSIWRGQGFAVTYKPWQSHKEMVNAKPVQDSLRLDLEFLNRTVQIIVEEGGDCWTETFDNTNQPN